MRARRRMLIASTSPQERQRLADAQLPGPGHERPDVLGQAAAAEAEAGLQEPAADPVVVGQRLGQLRHVRAGRLADLGHGVDEGDLGGQERVGRDLHQLGGGEVGDDERDAGGERLRVHLAQDAPRPAPTATPTTSRSGCSVSCDGEALAQELRVPGQLDPRPAGASSGQRARPDRGRARPARWTCPTIRQGRSRCGASAPIAARVAGRGRLRPSSARCGVPTQRKWTSPKSAASA